MGCRLHCGGFRVASAAQRPKDSPTDCAGGSGSSRGGRGAGSRARRDASAETPPPPPSPTPPPPRPSEGARAPPSPPAPRAARSRPVPVGLLGRRRPVRPVPRRRPASIAERAATAASRRSAEMDLATSMFYAPGRSPTGQWAETPLYEFREGYAGQVVLTIPDNIPDNSSEIVDLRRASSRLKDAQPQR